MFFERPLRSYSRPCPLLAVGALAAPKKIEAHNNIRLTITALLQHDDGVLEIVYCKEYSHHAPGLEGKHTPLLLLLLLLLHDASSVLFLHDGWFDPRCRAHNGVLCRLASTISTCLLSRGAADWHPDWNRKGRQHKHIHTHVPYWPVFRARLRHSTTEDANNISRDVGPIAPVQQYPNDRQNMEPCHVRFRETLDDGSSSVVLLKAPPSLARQHSSCLCTQGQFGKSFPESVPRGGWYSPSLMVQYIGEFGGGGSESPAQYTCEQISVQDLRSDRYKAKNKKALKSMR